MQDEGKLLKVLENTMDIFFLSCFLAVTISSNVQNCCLLNIVLSS